MVGHGWVVPQRFRVAHEQQLVHGVNGDPLVDTRFDPAT
jgi:hypothetical protein